MEQSSVHQTPQRAKSERILIYDAQCRLCVTAKERIERLGQDLNVRWVPYQSDEAIDRLGSEYRPGRPDVAFLVECDGTVQKGLDAFLPLVSGLRGGRMLQALMRIPAVRPLGSLLYRLMARHRYRLFGSVNCGCGRTEVCPPWRD